MSDNHSEFCPDCDGLSRRDFLKGVGTAAVVAATASTPLFAAPRAANAASSSASADSLVAQLYGSLTEMQKQAVCFGWDSPKRLMISNNWMIVPQKVGQFYTPDQQALITEIFDSQHSEGWAAKRLKQMRDDSGPGDIKNYSIAMFGHPGAGKFEWVMTGRHLTMRVDGHSQPGVAFGGPIFYGHAAQGFNEKPDHPGNVYWYQGIRANEVYKALDGKQQKQALMLGDVPPDAPETLKEHPASERPGIPVADMTHDQQELVAKVLADLLAPATPANAAEARKYIEENGGVKSLSMAFYKKEDIGNDGVWDVWRLEGPSMVWYFRGSPHVHTWVFISEKPNPIQLVGPSA